MAAPAATGWRRLSKRQQLGVILAGGVAVTWTVDAVALRPLRNRLGRLHQQVRDAEQRLLDAVAAGRDEATVTKAFAAYEPYVKASASPDTALAQMLSEVESAIRESGVVLLNLKPMQPKNSAAPPAKTEPRVLSVVMDGEASPEQLVRLLDQLHRSPRLLRVSELSVRVSEQKTLRTSMVISTLLVGNRSGS